MAIPAGTLTRRIQLVDPGSQQDAYGQVVPADVPTTFMAWAARADRGGGVREQDDELVATWDTSWTIRFRAALADISQRWLIVVGSRTWEIQHIQQLNADNGMVEGWRIFSRARLQA